MDVWVYHEEIIDPPMRIDEQVASIVGGEEKAAELAVLYPGVIYFTAELAIP